MKVSLGEYYKLFKNYIKDKIVYDKSDIINFDSLICYNSETLSAYYKKYMNIVNFSFKKIENIISIDEVEDFKESVIKNGGYNVLSQDTINWNRFYNKGEHYNIFGNKLTKKIEEITGINDLVFAYGFGAKYKLNGKLDPHYDNWNNTISMTLCLENLNKEWPIYVHKQKYNNPYSWRQTIYNIEKLNKNDIAEIKLKPGDGAIFSGSNHLHWRDNMENETSIVLLHWTKKKN